jgi:hypothetical protein
MDQSTYDPVSNRLIVFGGWVYNQVQSLNDVWVLTNANGIGGGSAWTQIAANGPAPPPRYGAAGFYDAGTNRLGLFAGQDLRTGATYNDFWLLDNANGLGGAPLWRHITPGGLSITPRFGSSGVYDSAHNRMIVFGGSVIGFVANETWVLSDANGVPATQLKIDAVLPNHGGQGAVTLQIVGGGFQQGSTVKLTGLGPDIVGTNTAVSSASALATTVNLAGAIPGRARS